MHAAHVACAERVAHGGAPRPRRVLEAAWQTLRRGGIIGSATVCLVALHPLKPELLCASVGDAGFLLLRAAAASGAASRDGGAAQYRVAFRSPQQLREFNAPYQLGNAPDSPPPPEVDRRFETPDDAALARAALEPGDVLVLATDGLFDNMDEEEIVATVERHEGDSAQALATALARRAQELSLDRDVATARQRWPRKPAP